MGPPTFQASASCLWAAPPSCASSASPQVRGVSLTADMRDLLKQRTQQMRRGSVKPAGACRGLFALRFSATVMTHLVGAVHADGGKQPALSVALMPRSLLVFAEDAYSECLHGIDAVRILTAQLLEMAAARQVVPVRLRLPVHCGLPAGPHDRERLQHHTPLLAAGGRKRAAAAHHSVN